MVEKRFTTSTTWTEEDAAALGRTLAYAFSKNAEATVFSRAMENADTLPFHACTGIPLRTAYDRKSKRMRPFRVPSADGESTGRILRALLDQATRLGISRIRFYHFEENDDDAKLVSVDCVGHHLEVARRIRIGHVVQFRSSSPLQSSQSFWAFALGVPVLFRLDDKAPARHQPRLSGTGLPVIEMSCDSEDCRNVLVDKARVWLDVPLTVGGKYIGKLSCDVQPAANPDWIQDDILQFWHLAEGAAPCLDALYRAHFTSPLSEVAAHITACSSISELLEFCVYKLPRNYFSCRYASIFTLSKDSLGSQRLVLRKTSYPAAQPLVGVGSYDLDEASLTSWVARTARPLRVHNLQDDESLSEALEKQLQSHFSYDKRLAWKKKIQDSDRNATFLAVPICSAPNRIEGVLRFTEKDCDCEDDEHFTERDQVLLEEIARAAIGPKLMALRKEECARTVSFGQLQEVITVSMGEPTHILAIRERFGHALEKFFPEKDGARKLYLFNLLEDDAVAFLHHAVGGSLRFGLERYENSRQPLRGTLTGRALRQTTGAVFVNDPARASEMGAMRIISPDVVCALACRVSFRSKHYGVLIVKSDRHDLFLDSHGRLLEVLATQAGATLARHEVASLRSLRKIMSDEKYLPKYSSGEIRLLSGYLSHAIETYGQASPVQETLLDTVDLSDLVRSAAQEALGDRQERLWFHIQDLKIRANPAILSMIVFNLVAHRAECLKKRSGRILVWADVGQCSFRPADHQPWLKVQVRGTSVMGGWGSDDVEMPFMDGLCLDSLGTQEPHETRLLFAKSLAYWHQVAGRRGQVSLLSSRRVGATFPSVYLPVTIPQ